MTDQPFERLATGGLRVRFDPREADVLRGLVNEMRTVLRDEDDDDPVSRRLFPDAYDSDADARAYRELIGDELRSGKLAALDVVEQTVGARGAVAHELNDDEINGWLTALTDIRLTLGTRLDVTEETLGAEVDPGDPDAFSLYVLHWLGWLQESILEQISG